MSLIDTVSMFLKYKAWANKITFSSLVDLPGSEIYKERETNFKNIASTLNHVYTVDDIFRAHLNGVSHGYTSRNTDVCPKLHKIWSMHKEMDNWYFDHAAGF